MHTEQGDRLWTDRLGVVRQARAVRRADFLQFDVSAYHGLITDTRLTLEHDTFHNFGWGIGFNGFRVNGQIDGNSDLVAKLDYGYQGLMVYLRFML